MKIAVVGAGHWHVWQAYLPFLKTLDWVEVVGLAEPKEELLNKAAEGWDCPLFADYRQMLDKVQPDFVFAQGPHAQLTGIAHELVGRHLPFHMEKPGGIDWREMEPVAAKARTEGLFNSMALVGRHYASSQVMRQMRLEGTFGQPVHYYYRLFGGSPNRYIDWGSEWMLDPKIAGGGPIFNFGPHCVDLFLYLMDDVKQVRCLQSHAVHHLEIEDHSTILMEGETGAIGVVEVGYTLPEGYSRPFSVTTALAHYSGDFGEGTLLLRDRDNVEISGVGTKTAYETYTEHMLRAFQDGKPPIADLTDMMRIVRVLNAAQESARTGEAVKIGPAADDE